MISKFHREKEFYTPERCHIIEIHNLANDKNTSVARARVEPGVTTKLHSLAGITERYIIIEGKGDVEVDGDMEMEVKPLDVITIPAGVSQRITNTSNIDLIFLVICTPRFETQAYVNLED